MRLKEGTLMAPAPSCSPSVPGLPPPAAAAAAACCCSSCSRSADMAPCSAGWVAQHSGAERGVVGWCQPALLCAGAGWRKHQMEAWAAGSGKRVAFNAQSHVKSAIQQEMPTSGFPRSFGRQCTNPTPHHAIPTPPHHQYHPKLPRSHGGWRGSPPAGQPVAGGVPGHLQTGM